MSHSLALEVFEDDRESDHDEYEEDDFEGIERRRILASRAYQQGTQYISMDLILESIDLTQYSEAFMKAGEDMVETHAHRDDEDVDAVLNAVEKTVRMKFPYEHRNKLWKALRYRWFRSPDAAKPFIGRAELPLLILPKKDFKALDDHIDIKALDSERQLMITRRYVVTELEGTKQIQEEVYKRQNHMALELAGLERTMEYWMSQDPRKMAREDPREEVLLNQTKVIELEAAARIDKLKISRRIHSTIYNGFRIIKVIFICLSTFFLVIGIIDSRTNAGDVPTMERFLSKSYVRCASLYFASFWCLLEITKKRPSFQFLDEARRMHAKCRLMYSDMIAFRLKTHYVRQDRVPRFLDEANLIETNGENEKPKQPQAIRATGALTDGAFDEYMSRQGSSLLKPGELPEDRYLLRKTTGFSTVERAVLPDEEGEEERALREVRVPINFDRRGSVVEDLHDMQEDENVGEDDSDWIDLANLEFDLSQRRGGGDA